MLSNEFDAILAGAFGDPRVPSNQHAEDILLGMRRGLDLYINLRPVRLLDARLTPLRDRKVEDVDFVVFRENTEGAYCGAGGFLKKGTADEIATQDELNTRRGVERIICRSLRICAREWTETSDDGRQVKCATVWRRSLAARV